MEEHAIYLGCSSEPYSSSHKIFSNTYHNPPLVDAYDQLQPDGEFIFIINPFIASSPYKP